MSIIFEDLPTADTENAEAHLHYLRGRFHWDKRTKEGFLRAIDEFEAAIAADSTHARAHTGIADAWMLLANYGYTPLQDALPTARAAVEKAREYGPLLAETHTSRGFLELLAWNWATSEAAFDEAIRLDPEDAAAYVSRARGNTLLGRDQQAQQDIIRAVDLGFDPVKLEDIIQGAKSRR